MIAKVLTWLIAYVVPDILLLGGLSGLWISTSYLIDAFSSPS